MAGRPFANRLRSVADQPQRLADPRHHRVAGVGALGAMDALHLQTFADVDPGRAGDHASRAVDAVAVCLSGFTTGTDPPARLAAAMVM